MRNIFFRLSKTKKIKVILVAVVLVILFLFLIDRNRTISARQLLKIDPNKITQIDAVDGDLPLKHFYSKNELEELLQPVFHCDVKKNYYYNFFSPIKHNAGASGLTYVIYQNEKPYVIFEFIKPNVVFVTFESNLNTTRFYTPLNQNAYQEFEPIIQKYKL